MDEKELIRRIKTSINAGKTDNEILLFLQQSGYKLEYATLMLKKARKGKRITKYTIIIFFIILLVLVLSYFGSNLIFLSSSNPQGGQGSSSGSYRGGLKNPLEGLNVIFEPKSTNNTSESVEIIEQKNNSVNESTNSGDSRSSSNDVYIEDIVVTTEFITYLMYGLGAHELKSNPITGSKPIINFDIDSKDFHSIVDSGKIESFDGLSENSDISFYSNKEYLVKAMLSEEPIEVFKESYNLGYTTLEVQKNEATLYAKGYLNFYESLNS